MPFSCKLEKGNFTAEISAEFNTIKMSLQFSNPLQAEQMAKRIASNHMQTGWKLVMLNGKGVKQGKLVLPTQQAISKIEKLGTKIPLGDGTVGV